MKFVKVLFVVVVVFFVFFSKYNLLTQTTVSMPFMGLSPPIM